MSNQVMREALTKACRVADHAVVTTNKEPIIRPLPKVSKGYKKKGKAVPYRELRDCYTFKYFDKKAGGERIYTKVNNAFAIDERTGKDAIFAGNDRVIPLYPVSCSLI